MESNSTRVSILNDTSFIIGVRGGTSKIIFFKFYFNLSLDAGQSEYLYDILEGSGEVFGMKMNIIEIHNLIFYV